VPGVWLVRSRTIKKDGTSEPVWYEVIVDGEDIACQCQDDQYRGGSVKTPHMCAHILAAAMREAMRRVFEAEDSTNGR
jgi:hypothetical protein